MPHAIARQSTRRSPGRRGATRGSSRPRALAGDETRLLEPRSGWSVRRRHKLRGRTGDGGRMAVLRPVHRPRHHRRPQRPLPSRRRHAPAELPHHAPISNACTAPGRSATRFSTAATIRPSSSSVATTPARKRICLETPEGIALIGDPRNDSHLFMAQLYLAMLRLHTTASSIICGRRASRSARSSIGHDAR